MTIAIYGDTCAFSIQASAMQFHLASLKSRIASLKQLYAEMKATSVEPIIANLRTLLDEAEVVRSRPLEVRFTVGSVELEDVWIGDMEVTLGLESFSIKVRNRSADTKSRGGFPHPHVNTHGDICWNEHEDEARAYHAAGDYLALKDLIENLLRTYNDRSPYISLNDWVDGIRSSCGECGERWEDEELVYIDAIQEAICPSCRSYCEQCEEDVLERDFDTDFDACANCVREETTRCEVCQQKVWKTDLASMEIMDDEENAETVFACIECRRAHEHQQEERRVAHARKISTNYDHSDPICLLASPMVLSPHPV